MKYSIEVEALKALQVTYITSSCFFVFSAQSAGIVESTDDISPPHKCPGYYTKNI